MGGRRALTGLGLRFDTRDIRLNEDYAGPDAPGGYEMRFSAEVIG